VSIFTHDLHALSGSAALDALDGKELARYERHLRRCPSCASEVRGLAETATRIAMAASLPPPPGLREWVLTAATRTRQLPPVSDQRPQSQLPRIPRLALVIAVAIVAAVSLSIALAAVRHQLGRAQAQSRADAAVLAAPDAHLVRHATSAGGTVTAVVSQRLHETLVTADGLPRLTGARVYELWFLGPGGTRRIGLLPAPESGRAGPLLARGLKRGDKIGLTVEPSGGTRQPTVPPILVMPLPA
jgi:hypothetical protein